MIFRYFDVLFDLTITHDYYESELSPDFTLVPTNECKRNLARHGMLFRSTPNGGQIIAEKFGEKGIPDAEKKVLRAIAAKQRFTFIIALNNPNFANFTHLGDPIGDFTGRPIYYLTNINRETGVIDDGLDSDAKLSLSEGFVVSNLDVIYLLPSVFTLPITASQPFDQLTVRKTVPVDGLQPVGISLEPETFGPETGAVQLDFRNQNPGRYRLEMTDSSGGSPASTKDIYVDPSLLNRPIFGLLEIFKDENTDYSQKVSYFIQFQNKVGRWKYFVINSTGNENIADPGESPQISIIPPEIGPGINPVYHPILNSVQFNHVDNPGPSDQAVIDSFFPDDCFLFEASEDIPFFERPLAGIKLVRTEDGMAPESGGDNNTVLLNNLPNVSTRSITPENIFINI